MYRETKKVCIDKCEQEQYKLLNRELDFDYVVNKLGELEDFVEAIQDFYGISKDSGLLEILELLFVFKTSYINLTNGFDQLSTRYRDLIRERDED